jgi:hypothetical protein
MTIKERQQREAHDIEPSSEDIERWTRNLMRSSPPSEENPAERRMIAKVLGTQTAANHFLRNQSPSHAHVHARERRYRPIEVRLRFEYWEGSTGTRWLWHIERYENGMRVSEHTGDDWKKRDDLLIKLEAAGMTCTPITVAGNEPRPIQGRKRDQRKAPSGRFNIIAKIGKLTTEDLEIDY